MSQLLEWIEWFSESVHAIQWKDPIQQNSSLTNRTSLFCASPELIHHSSVTGKTSFQSVIALPGNSLNSYLWSSQIHIYLFKSNQPRIKFISYFSCEG